MRTRPFTHDEPGTPARDWATHPRRAALPALDVPAGLERLVVVAAHPDDESLGAGGLVALAARAGVAVHLVLLTAGEHSHPRSRTVTPAQLAVRRLAESRLALSLLAPEATTTDLRLGDGAVAAVHDEIVTALVGIVGDGRGVLLVAPWRHDGHPDHEAAGRATAAAARRTGAALLEFPVWRWHHTAPAELPDEVWARLRVLPLDDDTRLLKAGGIARHRSQVAPLSAEPGDEALLTPSFLAHFTADEVYVVEPPVDPALEAVHADVGEPWGADTRWYERRKRDLLLALLPRPRFGRGLEVGCSTGVLAVDLAARCDRLTAVDASESALDRARERAAGLPGLDVRRCELPQEWPEGRFDLVVCSEVGYFLSPADLDLMADRVRGSLTDDGVVVLAHWRHEVVGYVLDGPEVHRRLVDRVGLAVRASYVDADVELLLLGPAGALPDPSS